MTVNLDPVIFSLGPISVRWYGLMYVIGFLLGAYLLKVLYKKKLSFITPDQIDTLTTYVILGMFIGARLFYVTIYDLDNFIAHPEDIIAVWKGGLSFHGAIVGLATSLYLFARKFHYNVFSVYDLTTTVGSIGLFFGRLGNFINGELYGRISNVPWAMVFPAGGPLARHPSQLYEAFFEGLVLFSILWSTKKHLNRPGFQSGLFVMGYAFMRFNIEFFREADSQMGYYFGETVTMGQILCFLMFIAGLMIFTLAPKISERLKN